MSLSRPLRKAMVTGSGVLLAVAVMTVVGPGVSAATESDCTLWPIVPDCAGGRSPVSLIPAQTRGIITVRATVTSRQTVATLVNDGQSVRATFPRGSGSLTGGILDLDSYELAEIEFHAPGQHRVNGVRSAMEIDLVFYNKKYPTNAEASKHRDGLAAIAVMADEDPASGRFAELTTSFEQIVEAGTSVAFPVDPADFLPAKSVPSYLGYPGSLIDRPDTEGVKWIVLAGQDDRIKVDPELIRALKNARTPTGDPQQSPGRVFPVGGRPVLRTGPVVAVGS